MRVQKFVSGPREPVLNISRGKPGSCLAASETWRPLFSSTRLASAIAFQPREFQARHFRPDKRRQRQCRNFGGMETPRAEGKLRVTGL